MVLLLFIGVCVCVSMCVCVSLCLGVLVSARAWAVPVCVNVLRQVPMLAYQALYRLNHLPLPWGSDWSMRKDGHCPRNSYRASSLKFICGKEVAGRGNQKGGRSP